MRYKIETWTIEKLLDTFNNDRLNLNPPYQRNDIWTEKAQIDLIFTIKKGLPIPNFFLHEQANGYDIADGQQRTRALLQYRNGEITDGMKNKYAKERDFLDYKLSVQIIDSNVTESEIMEFYVKVNRSGLKLNSSELRKADRFESRILAVLEDITQSYEFKSLNIFTSKQQDRMIDREFVEELATFLLFGIQDKKEAAIKKLYGTEITLSDEDLSKMKSNFKNTLSIINTLGESFNFSKSRYSQRNDFYTVFQFIHENYQLGFEFFKKCFDVLFKIEPDIKPSNDRCEPFQDYALHCVSQSNSKKAREHRIYFLNQLLLNKSSEPNNIQKLILKYYDVGIENGMIQNSGFFILNPEALVSKFI